MIRYAVFDVDGTLLDSMHIWDTAGSRYLELQGIAAPDTLYDALKTFTLEEAAQYLIQHFPLSKTVSEVCDEVNAMIKDDYARHLPVKDGIPAIFDLIRAKKIPICAATASDPEHVNLAFKRLGILEYFDTVYTCSQLGLSKNSPAFYRTVADQCQRKPAELLVFEDVLHAAASAKQAGCHVVGVYDKRAHKQSVQLTQLCDLYMHSFADEADLKLLLTFLHTQKGDEPL